MGVRLWRRQGIPTDAIRETLPVLHRPQIQIVETVREAREPRRRSSEIREARGLMNSVMAPEFLPERLGIDPSIPRGGATVNNPIASAYSRNQILQDLMDAYLACTPASASIQTISRTITAGGPMLHSRYAVDVPGGGFDTEIQAVPKEAMPLQRLLDYINPKQDAKQFFRGICNDIQWAGDSFTEVVWWMGAPVAMYDLDPTTMTVVADTHGHIFGYAQKVGDRLVQFAPHQVIQVSYDSPRTTLYGTGPMEMNLGVVTAWMFTEALMKERMRKGDPPVVHGNVAAEIQQPELERWRQKYLIRNIGTPNIGNPILSRGIEINELKKTGIKDLIEVLNQQRDLIIIGLGAYPAKIGVIESGNIGGGTGTSQDKSFKVNTCQPIGGSVMEKFNFHLTWEAFNLPQVQMLFREIDWRDDKTIDDIDSQRVRDGRITINRARDNIGEPPVEGGDKPFIVNRQDMVLLSDLEAYSHASLSSKQGAASGGPGATLKPKAGAVGGGGVKPVPSTSSSESVEDATHRRLTESWGAKFKANRRQALGELPRS